MRVLICPDKFAGTLSAPHAAAAIAAGWLAVAPADELDVRPLADGGPGFTDVIGEAIDGKRHTVATTDPLGRPVIGEIVIAGETAYIESAQACGLHLLSAEDRDPKITSSYGLGALVRAALDAGATEVVIGLGGSGTNDGGAGFLSALGLTITGADGVPVPMGGAGLGKCAEITGTPVIFGPRVVGATDVDSPLTGIFGASAVYGPQKGATREDVLILDAALEHYARVLSDSLPKSPPDLAARPGAGAAGGLGAAILALGGSLRSGLRLVAELTQFDAAVEQADLVITGEGELDAQSVRGKVVGGVANAARDLGVPCVVLAGQSSAGRREALSAGVTDVYTLADHFGNVATAKEQAAAGLAALGSRLARQWSARLSQG